MGVKAFVGFLLYGGIAAAVAAICFRTWRFGTLPKLVAAACTTAATLAIGYASTGDADLFDPLVISVLFAVAWFIAHAVQVVTLKMRELDA